MHFENMSLIIEYAHCMVKVMCLISCVKGCDLILTVAIYGRQLTWKYDAIIKTLINIVTVGNPLFPVYSFTRTVATLSFV